MRCRWDVGYCDVFPTYIRFYLDGRKNSQYGGDFWDVAAPEKPGEMGVYHIALMAREVFRSEDTSRCGSPSFFLRRAWG